MSVFVKPLPLIEVEGFKISFEMLWIKEDTPFLGKTAKGVVLLVPVYNTSMRCWNLFNRALERLDPMPEKVIFLENNSIDDTLNLVWNVKYPHEVIRVWFRDDATKGPLHEYDGIANARDLLLTRARTYGAKMAIFLDDDCIPRDKDFIQQFIDNKLDICGGTYTREFVEGNLVASKWWIEALDDMPVETPEKRKAVVATIDQARIKNFPMMAFDYIDFVEGKLYKCSVTSAGAMALGEKVLQDRRLNFAPVPHHLSRHPLGTSEDFGFCLLCASLGYTIYLDFKIKFGHLGSTSQFFIKERPWVVDSDFKY